MIPAVLALALTSTDSEIVIEEVPVETIPAPAPIVALRAHATVRFDATSSVDLAFDREGEQIATFGTGGRLELEVEVADWLTAFAAPAIHFLVAHDEGGGNRYALFLNKPEGWVRARFGQFDLSLGALVFNWGKSDLIAPNDVLNPIDYRRNIVASAEDTKIPVIAAELVMHGDPVTLRAVVQPFFTAARFFLVGWDSSLIAAPLAERLALPGPLLDAIAESVNETQPQLEAENVTLAARAEARLGDLDLAATGVYGWDPLPQITIANATSSYVRRKLLGFDASLLIDPLVLKLDTAFTFERSMYTQTLVPVTHPWLNTVLGAEYSYGDHLRIELELFLVAIFDVEERLLLFEEIASEPLEERNVLLPGAAAFVRYAILGGDLRFEIAALTTPTRGDVVVLPAIRYRFFDQHDLSLQATIIQGKDDSYGGAYDHNDEIGLTYRWER